MIAKQWQQVEGALVFAAAISIYLYFDVQISWWFAILLFFTPDLSFFAYIVGSRIGAFCYNLLHLYGIGIAIFAVALIAGANLWMGVGLLFLAHSGFDRMLGYGLKSAEGFQITHLGKIGKDS